MRTFSKILSTATVGALALTATMSLAGSHGADNPAVKARQAQMQLYAFNLSLIGGMAKGAVDYDAEAASAAAGNLVKLSSLSAGAMWVPGTDSMDAAGSKAKPELWENMDDVIAKATAMNAAAVAMEAAAGNGLEALQGAMGALGGSCGGCHKAYRESDD